MSDFVTDFYSDLGLDANDPQIQAELRDAQATMNLIETLTHLRKGRGLVQDDVAARMRTTQSRVSSFERLAGNPRLDTVLSYARAVGAELRFSVKCSAPVGWNAAGPIVTTAVRDAEVEIEGQWERSLSVSA